MRNIFGLSLAITFLGSTSLVTPLKAQTVDRPVGAVIDAGVVTTRQAVTPAGVQTIFDGRVHASAFGKDNILWVLSRSHLYQFDWLENRMIAKVAIDGIGGIRGLTIDPVTGDPLISTVTGKSKNPNPKLPEMPGKVRLMRWTNGGFMQVGRARPRACSGARARGGREPRGGRRRGSRRPALAHGQGGG